MLACTLRLVNGHAGRYHTQQILKQLMVVKQRVRAIVIPSFIDYDSLVLADSEKHWPALCMHCAVHACRLGTPE